MSVTTPHHNPKPRLAASVIVLRDSAHDMEVLMLRRAERANDHHQSGAAVFPGGLLDGHDRGRQGLCRGLDDAGASARLGLCEGGLDYWVAAIRECFEEAGLLLAVDARGRWANLAAQDQSALRERRHRLHAGLVDLTSLCEDWGLTLATDKLHYFSHWVTPPGRPKRFDTRFFVAEVPEGQTAIADETETAEVMWLTPSDAITPSRALKLLPVTRETLKSLANYRSVAEVIAAARAAREVPCMMPRAGVGADGPRPVLPSEWAYAEIRRLDPDGRGDVSFEIVPGRAVRLSPRIVRVTAGNGSLMTGPGTNSYFVHDPTGTECVLIDPGPNDQAHVQALLAAAPLRIARILVTHTHKDHSPAAQVIHQATGALLCGRVADHPEWQDATFRPDHVLSHGDRVSVGPDCTLRVVRTPGHASNHLCYLLEQEQLLFTGDHLMQGSTVVINPPDGDMRVYLDSLHALLGLELEWLAPGHGFLIDRPHDVVRRTVAHRRQREAKVVDALRAAGRADLDALLPVVYQEVPLQMRGVAARSLRAHLLKLRADGRAREEAGFWALV